MHSSISKFLEGGEKQKESEGEQEQVLQKATKSYGRIAKPKELQKAMAE
jgi:hypothetical protein